MTPEVEALVRRLRGLIELATNGPWYAKPPGDDGSVWIEADEDGDYPIAMIASGSPHSQDIHDGNLIVEAVNALPTLLAALSAGDATNPSGSGTK